MTDDQLKAMEATAPLLVAEVHLLRSDLARGRMDLDAARKQLKETEEVLAQQLTVNARQREELESIRALVDRLVSFGMGN